jgi:hypothetical protein
MSFLKATKSTIAQKNSNLIWGMLFMKSIIKNKNFIGIMLIVSLLGNFYLLNELYKANQIDKVASANNFHTWETRYQMLTQSLGRVLEDVNDKESYNELIENTEFIRIFQTVPMNNYYGSKNAQELGNSLLILTDQIVDVVYENFDATTKEQLDKLREFHNNLEELSAQFNHVFEEARESSLKFSEYQIELSSHMENTIENNKSIFPHLKERY